MSIYNPLYGITAEHLPSQSVPLKKKLKKRKNSTDPKVWSEVMMDSMETIGRAQYSYNLKLIENYEMIKGRFIFEHYFSTEGYQSMITQLTSEFEMPSYLRHYDIIGQVVNTMSGEWQARPDLFKIKQIGEAAGNEYLRSKTDLTKKYLFEKIQSEINKKLAEQGIDVNKQDFGSPQEKQQYQQQVQQMTQQMTPPQIQKYMDTDFMTQAEIWAQHQKDYDQELFNLAEKEKREFEDMLIADRCFRHFYLTPTSYAQETWNPINVFYHKSPDVTEIEDGDYVGRIFNLTLNDIIDRYGYLFSKDDWSIVTGYEKDDNTNWDDKDFEWIQQYYNMPFKGYPAYDIMRSSWNRGKDGSVPEVGDDFFRQMNFGDTFGDKDGFYFVTEAYWKTQKKIIKLTYQDEQTGELIIKLVDENYVIPKTLTESNKIFTDDHDINTYCYTWVNEVWKGVKINTGVNHGLKRDLYLDIGPADFQFKGDANIYGSKLPVCGQVFSVRNSRSMSLVDMMKPYQIGYNVVINQLYQLAEKEIGQFLIMDVNMFPNSKDWGGEEAWDKWMMIAKNLGVLPADTSPQNIKGSLAATGGFLPKVMDLNLAAQMVSRMNLAKFYEEQALKQVGFNAFRTGAQSPNSTAQEAQQGRASSYSQTESYFTNFSNYLRRCYSMGLSIAQYVQSQKEDIIFTYVKSDASGAFIKIAGIDLLLANLGVVVTNSQENSRQLDMIRQFALTNNTSGLTPVDVANIITMNSPQEIKRELEISFAKAQQTQQQQVQLQKQQVDQAHQEAQQELAIKHKEHDDLMQNNLDRERIKIGGDIIANTQDPPPVDTSKQDTIDLKKDIATSADNIKQQKIDLDRQKLQADTQKNEKQLAVDQSKINSDNQVAAMHNETARIFKGK